MKALVAVVLCAIAAFCCKDWLFAVVMAPSKSEFVTYALFARLTGVDTDFRIQLFNPELAQQFLVHMRVALWMGLLIVSPYLLERVQSQNLPNEHDALIKAVTKKLIRKQ